MDSSLRLYFTTDQGKNATITIPRANPSYNPNTIKNAMREIVFEGMVQNKQGTLTNMVKAKLVNVTTVDFNV